MMYIVLKRHELIHGITKGFPIPSDIKCNPLPPGYTNDKSAFENMEKVSYKLQQELNLHRIAGPLTQKPSGLILSSLAAKLKNQIK